MSELPRKDLFRPDEVAEYFSVSAKTIYLWIDQGKLKAEKIVGTVRVLRGSILQLRQNQRRKGGK